MASSKRRLSLSGRATADEEKRGGEASPDAVDIQINLLAHRKRMEHMENNLVETDSALFEDMEKNRIVTNIMDHHRNKCFVRVDRSSNVRPIT
eukprot:11642837-Karenia_brevis.AAC.1